MPATPFTVGAHLMMTGKHTEFPRHTWGEHLRYVRQMSGPGGWAVQVVQINDLNPEKWNAYLEAVFALELRPVLRLATYPGEGSGHWVQPDADAPAAWADFFTQLELTQPVWVVVGNEPNSGAEWGGRADPSGYAGYFVATTRRLRQLEQPIFISMAALDLYAPHTNDLSFSGLDITMMDAAAFWDGVFAAQPRIMRYVDFWASHAYPDGPFTRPPWEQTFRFDRVHGAERLPILQPPSGVHNRGVNGYEWERWYLHHDDGR